MDDRNDYRSLVDSSTSEKDIIESNDICCYCDNDIASLSCRGCLPTNGRAGFTGKKVRAL